MGMHRHHFLLLLLLLPGYAGDCVRAWLCYDGCLHVQTIDGLGEVAVNRPQVDTLRPQGAQLFLGCGLVDVWVCWSHPWLLEVGEYLAVLFEWRCWADWGNGTRGHPQDMVVGGELVLGGQIGSPRCGEGIGCRLGSGVSPHDLRLLVRLFVGRDGKHPLGLVSSSSVGVLPRTVVFVPVPTVMAIVFRLLHAAYMWHVLLLLHTTCMWHVVLATCMWHVLVLHASMWHVLVLLVLLLLLQLV